MTGLFHVSNEKREGGVSTAYMDTNTNLKLSVRILDVREQGQSNHILG
jgi:hypothetical protein